MNSQPDIKIRRLVVFGGYGDLEASTTWSRRGSRRRDSADEGSGVLPRRQPETAAIALTSLAPPRELPVAA